MNIFNSLGSNYDLRFVMQSLFTLNVSKDLKKLESYLENKYKGKVMFFYKGRDALECALKIADLPQGSKVAINGFTCYAVYKAIKNVNLNVEYLDILKDDLNFSAESLQDSIKKNPQIKAVIIQNTLGYPCKIDKIQKVCKEKNIILIEDLAHSIGAVYENGIEAGMIGDFTVLSFSQDKMIDGVSGGALVIKDTKIQRYKDTKIQSIAKKKEMIDRFYPLFTFLIRSFYRLQIGKMLHAFFKKTHLLSMPMDGGEEIYRFPGWNAQVIYDQFRDLGTSLKHRRKIAGIYAVNINPGFLIYSKEEQIEKSSNLRFPVIVNNRELLIKYLKSFGIYISDIWYDAPIAPKKYLSKTDYDNQCPEAEKISDQVLNLPTHKNVSDKDAIKIAKKINLWLKLQ